MLKDVLEKIDVFEVGYLHISLKTHKWQGRMKGLYSFSATYSYRFFLKYIRKRRFFLKLECMICISNKLL